MKRASTHSAGWLVWFLAFGWLEWHAIVRARRELRLTTLSDHVDAVSMSRTCRVLLQAGWVVLAWHWWGPRARWRHKSD